MPPAYVLRPFPQLTSRYDFVLAPPVPFPMLSSRTQFNPGDFKLKRPIENNANETSRPSKKPRLTRRSPTPEVMVKFVSEYNLYSSEGEEDEDENENENESEDEDEDPGSTRAATSFRQVAFASGLVVLVAELGDLIAPRLPLQRLAPRRRSHLT